MNFRPLYLWKFSFFTNNCCQACSFELKKKDCALSLLFSLSGNCIYSAFLLFYSVNYGISTVQLPINRTVVEKICQNYNTSDIKYKEVANIKFQNWFIWIKSSFMNLNNTKSKLSCKKALDIKFSHTIVLYVHNVELKNSLLTYILVHFVQFCRVLDK